MILLDPYLNFHFGLLICNWSFLMLTYRIHTVVGIVNQESAMKTHQIKCNTCDSTFVSKQNLKVHENTIHKGLKVKCSECGKQFTGKSYLTKRGV